MLKSVRGEYARRGKPLERTGWSVFEVHDFMQAWLQKIETGEDVGVRAHQLPKRPNEQEPAPMPDWVIKYHEERADAEEVNDSDGPADYPSEGYKIRRGSNRGPWQLSHPDVSSMVELPGLPNKEAKYYVYHTRDGDCVWVTDESSEPQFCKDIFEQLLGSSTAAGGGGVSAGSPQLAGQVAASGPPD